MKVQDFLSHHGIRQNPFSEEDAQTDPVFKECCIDLAFHPAWDKIFGNPGDPSTSIVFGEKGSGKTALRLQMEKHIATFNADNPHARCCVVCYDDFNPILDEFRERVGKRHRKPGKVLSEFQLWDHMDAILSVAVTDLLNGIFKTRSQRGDEHAASAIPTDFRKRLSRHQRRDLLLLAAFYDNSTSAPLPARWKRLQRRLHGWSLSSWWPFLAGTVVTAASLWAVGYLWWLRRSTETAVKADLPGWIVWGIPLLFVAGWLPWLLRNVHRWWVARGIAKRIRVIRRYAVTLCRMLMHVPTGELRGQPLPNKDRTDDRYRLLAKLQSILESLDFTGITVLVDRVDEPHLINGSADAMRAMLWPMLDNKFLKLPGLGIKFLLPAELTQFIDREDRDFYQRARLDKQNLVPSLNWTGPALYDLANTRIAACSSVEPPKKLTALLDESISVNRLFESLQMLRVPRHMFRFIYRAIVSHCNHHSDDAPEWRISAADFESEFAVYRREQDAADRGLASG